MSDRDFKSHFRMKPSNFEFVHSHIHRIITPACRGSRPLSTRVVLMIAIWKMATPESYRSVADRFDVTKPTAFSCVCRVTSALCEVAPIFIKWPTGERVNRIVRGFEVLSGFPNILGAVDGTHIRVFAPQRNPIDYVNRKGYHSMQLQVVCDHKMRFIHVETGYPGCVHDARVFKRSEVSDYLDQDGRFPQDTHLVGDAAYPLHPRLLVPFRDNGHLTPDQLRFNHKHSIGRVIIERAIGLLKMIWRSLLDRLPVNLVPGMVKFIMACCVLHNICLLKTEELSEIGTDHLLNDGRVDVNQPAPPINNRRTRNEGAAKRDTIMVQLCNSL